MSAGKPEIQEQLGVAVNSSNLQLGRGEGDLLRVAALGAASLRISTGADLQGLPVAAMAPEVYRQSVSMADVMLDPGTPDQRDAIAAELGPMLWHIRFGAQHGMVPKAIGLYARWLRLRPLFREYAAEGDFLERFSTRVLHEWLSDRCQPCGGSGKRERTRNGTLIRPRGSMQRNAVFAVCKACHGNGRSAPSHGERARWLNLTMAKYDSERWGQRFNAALIWLSHFHADRVKRPLTAELERRKRRG